MVCIKARVLSTKFFSEWELFMSLHKFHHLIQRRHFPQTKNDSGWKVLMGTDQPQIITPLKSLCCRSLQKKPGPGFQKISKNQITDPLKNLQSTAGSFMLTYQNWVLEFLRTMFLNHKNCHDNPCISGHVSNNCPTLK